MASKKGPRKEAAAASEFSSACAAADIPCILGKAAIHNHYREGVIAAKGCSHTHSTDFDSCHKAAYPQENRWDYGLGIASEGRELALWVEAHPASSTGEVTTMLAKLAWLQGLLRVKKYAALRGMTEATVESGALAFRWLAQTGTISITPNSKEARRLAVAGMAAPRRTVSLP